MSGLETAQPGAGRGGAPRIGAALLRLALALALIYTALGAGLTYWQVAQAQSLTEDPRNPLVLAATRNAPRGRILDARGVVLASNRRAADGTPIRRYSYPVMTPVLGYKSLIFGTSGLEQAYDAELVGLGQLSPADRLLRKFRRDPYDPQDLHLSIDVRLQARAMQLLGRERGAVVAIEPSTGRVLAMASAPTFDANRVVDLERGGTYFEALRRQPPERTALLNRATQAR